MPRVHISILSERPAVQCAILLNESFIAQFVFIVDLIHQDYFIHGICRTSCSIQALNLIHSVHPPPCYVHVSMSMYLCTSSFCPRHMSQISGIPSSSPPPQRYCIPDLLFYKSLNILRDKWLAAAFRASSSVCSAPSPMREFVYGGASPWDALLFANLQFSLSF